MIGALLSRNALKLAIPAAIAVISFGGGWVVRDNACDEAELQRRLAAQEEAARLARDAADAVQQDVEQAERRARTLEGRLAAVEAAPAGDCMDVPLRSP